MKLRTVVIVAMLAVLAGCGAQSSSPQTYPSDAAAATVVIVDTDLGNVQLSVQDGDQVIAIMQGRQYTKVSLRPGTHTFSAGAGLQSLGGGTVQVDVQPAQVIYLQVGGASSQQLRPAVPGFASSASGAGRAQGAIGVGGISQIPQSNAEFLMKQYTEQKPMPAS
jgi:hypothetical protein